MGEPETSKRRRIPLWPFFYCVLPILVGIGLVVFIKQPASPGNAADNHADEGARGIPSLGSHGRAMPGANDQPDRPGPEEETPDPKTEPETDPGEDDEVANTQREIDIWLSNLAIATRAGDRKGINLNHEMLRKARPHELVDERVENALLNETNARVRIQFFEAFHGGDAKLNWAMHVYDTRTSKFLGTDDEFDDGEPAELRIYAKKLLKHLAGQWAKDGTGDTRLMSFVRNVLDQEGPAWLFEDVVAAITRIAVEEELVDFARALEREIEGVLKRRTAKRKHREWLFAVYILTFDPYTAVLTRVEEADMWDYASVLPMMYASRARPDDADEPMLRFNSGGESNLFAALIESGEIPELIERLLAGAMPAEDKRLLIQRVAAHDVPNGRKMIEDGLDRRDENYPDYLTAFAWFAETAEQLQRLTTAADDPDVAAAQGAIEGLRQSRLRAADTELRKVLEQGANLGVKSQALGALLSRANEKDELLEEYLSENKSSALRAVAVAHIPESDVERLMRVVEEDASPSVRQAALNRLGAVTPGSTRQRKELYGFFVKVKSRDNSPVIRAAARKYAEEFKD